MPAPAGKEAPWTTRDVERLTAATYLSAYVFEADVAFTSCA